jgi:hypothetical protein
MLRVLSRPPTYVTYPTKFLCSELGAQTPADEKSDRYVNGAHGPGRRELLRLSTSSSYVASARTLRRISSSPQMYAMVRNVGT